MLSTSKRNSDSVYDAPGRPLSLPEQCAGEMYLSALLTTIQAVRARRLTEEQIERYARIVAVASRDVLRRVSQ